MKYIILGHHIIINDKIHTMDVKWLVQFIFGGIEQFMHHFFWNNLPFKTYKNELLQTYKFNLKVVSIFFR